MEEERAKARVVAESYLHHPIDLIEPAFKSAGQAALAVLGRCLEKCGDSTNHLPFYAWLGSLRGREGLAFYGSVMAPPLQPEDIDLLCLYPPALPPYHTKPGFVHPFAIYTDAENAAENSGILLSGSLLFLAEPPPATLAFIGLSRERLLTNPFFDGGIGELITHASMKVLLNEKERESEAVGLRSIPTLGIRVRFSWLDTANMATRMYSPHERNNQVRSQLQELKDGEVHSLAMAAMRRMRVREERKAELAERFVRELRAKRISGSFG